MIKEQKELYRSILLEKRKFVVKNIERLKDLSQMSENDSDRYERNSSHIADEGSDTAGIEYSFMFLSRELQYLNRIEKALAAIEQGNYGICRICGNEISHLRLEAVPTTDTCVECKSSEPKREILI
jgi:DnaK suppressor protein